MKRAGIDWENVRNRLRASEGALDAALAESHERIETAYRQRAVRLAKAQVAATDTHAGLPMLIFQLARERYAIEVRELAEVLPFARCTPVPGAAKHFRGVISLRGELRAVLDLGSLLVPSESIKDLGFVLVLRRPGRGIGLRVDRIEELRNITPGEPDTVPQGRYVNGVASGTLMLLNVEAVLADVF